MPKLKPPKACNECGTTEPKGRWLRGPLCGGCYCKRRYATNGNFRLRKLEYQKEYSKLPKARLTDARAKAVAKGTFWDIPEDTYFEALKLPCYYCGGPLNATGIGLDRLDPNSGYTIGNVVPCCRECNRIKSNKLTVREMRAVARLLVRMRNSNAEGD